MIIDNSRAILCMEKDIEYFYYDLVDLKSIPDNITIFSDTCDTLTNHSFVRVTVHSNEILIEVHTDNISLVSEAISFSKEHSDLLILLSVEKDTDISFLSDIFPIKLCDDQDNKHWGIFGAIKNAQTINKSDITVSVPSQEDIDSISNLSDKEWAFLPRRINFIKNILIASKGSDLAGYLVYDNAITGHYDIVMVYVHPNHRHCGVASALIKVFADECAKKNGVPYYVCANSAVSAKLAESLNIKKIRKETAIYELK